jgi:hypothetical protein
MLGVGNIATKVGDGDVIVGMFGVGNVLTHVGNGMSAALMVSVGASALIPPYMATLILPLPFLVTTFRPPNKEPLTLPVEKSVKTLALK